MLGLAPRRRQRYLFRGPVESISDRDHLRIALVSQPSVTLCRCENPDRVHVRWRQTVRLSPTNVAQQLSVGQSTVSRGFIELHSLMMSRTVTKFVISQILQHVCDTLSRCFGHIRFHVIRQASIGVDRLHLLDMCACDFAKQVPHRLDPNVVDVDCANHISPSHFSVSISVLLIAPATRDELILARLLPIYFVVTVKK